VGERERGRERETNVCNVKKAYDRNKLDFYYLFKFPNKKDFYI